MAICNLPIEDPTLEIVPTFEIQDTFVYAESSTSCYLSRLVFMS